MMGGRDFLAVPSKHNEHRTIRLIREYKPHRSQNMHEQHNALLRPRALPGGDKGHIGCAPEG